ncbi:MAG: hypothetical protein WD939_05665 [Dehalococcoidia bacterium]
MRRLVTIIGLGIMSLGALAACGGSAGPTLTLEQYFAEFQRIAGEAEADFNATPTRTPLPAGAADDDRIARARLLYEDIVASQKSFYDELVEITPPSEAKDAHDAFLGAGDESIRFFQGIVDSSRFDEFSLALEAAETNEERRQAYEIAGVGSYDPIEARLNAACLEIAAIATQHSIDFTLCDDD